MSFQSDSEVAANVAVGGSDRSSLFYDSSTHVWRTKNQAGTIADLNTVASVDGQVGVVSLSGTYQPLDSDLTAIAALSTTTYGRSLLTLSNQTALSGELSSFYQPLDSDLTAIAALATTSYGRALLTLADAAAQTSGLNIVTSSLKGLMSTTDKTRSDNWYNKAVYNVLDNGISSANSGATNVTAWNSLMTVLANSSATIYFPPASVAYDFASVCNIPAGVHLRIQGGSGSTRTSETFGTIIRTTSGTADIFSCSDWYQEFNSLTFRSSVTRTGGNAISAGNNVSIQAINCNFNAMFNGIVFTGGAQAGNLAFIDNCHFTDSVNFSIQVDGANANSIIRGTTADCSVASLAHLEVNQCGSLLISDCDFIHATNNMRLNPDSGTKGVFSVYCTNVFFDTSAASSVKFQGGAAGTNIQRVKFINCWFSGSVTGCEFASSTSTNAPTAVDFVNCDIYSNSANGILATFIQDFAMDNCRVAGNVTAGLNIVAAAGSVTKFNIQNNTFGPTAGVGANGIGVNVQAGTYGAYTITGNNVSGNTSNNNILDAGSVATTDLKQITDNLGHLINGAISSQGATPLSVPITTETLVLSARIPANSVTVGQVFRIRGIGVQSSTNVATWRLRVGAAGTVSDAGIPFTVACVAGAANSRHGCDVLLTVRSIGGAGTVNAEGWGYGGATTTVTTTQPTLGAATTATAVTNAVWFIDLTLSQTVGSTLIQQAVIEAL